MAPTPTRQRNAVSEGMALGLLMCGRDELRYEKVSIDLAFAGAWRAWPQRGLFKQVDTDLRHGLDPIHVITRAGERHQVMNLYWDAGWPPTICVRGYWQDNVIDATEIAESIDGDLPAEAWHQLAETFLSRLDRD